VTEVRLHFRSKLQTTLSRGRDWNDNAIESIDGDKERNTREVKGVKK
jgi:hypothetical protein